MAYWKIFEHFLSVGISLVYYLCLFAASYGYGKIILKILKLRPKNSTADYIQHTHILWLGFAGNLFIFQVIHFFFPLNFLSVGPVFFIGAALSIKHFWTTLSKINLSKLSSLNFKWIFLIGLGVVSASAWLASRAAMPPSHYDTGLYHLNIIRWTNSFEIIPGLGNLHGRLAFNQSFHSWIAALNLFPYFGHGRSIGNSWLLILIAIMLFESAGTSLRNYLRNPGNFDLPCFTIAILCMPVIVYWALSHSGLSSPSPDLTSSILQLTCFVLFCGMIGSPVLDDKKFEVLLQLLCVLCATMVTLKLSNIAFASSLVAFSWFRWLRRSRPSTTAIVRMIIPSVSIAGVHIIRGYILSGAPIYPSSLGYLTLEWSVPKEQVINEAAWVYSWARTPFAAPSEVLSSWRWLAPWFKRVSNDFTNVTFPLSVFIAGVVLQTMISQRLNIKSKLRDFYLLGPILTSLLFWFFTAPDPRFANALFFLLPTTIVIPLMLIAHERMSQALFWKTFALTVALSNFHFLFWFYQHRETISVFSRTGFQKTEQTDLLINQTKSGLNIFVPKHGDQCWDAPLPCTPYFNETLALRNLGNLASGFKINSISP